MKMRIGWMSGTVVAGVLAVLLTVAPAALRAAGEHDHGSHGKKGHSEHKMDGKTMTVKGEVVDMACYLGHGAKGKKHSKCAKRCLLGGTPAGILTDDGKLYLVVDSHSKKSKKAYKKVLRLAAKRVSLKGKLHISDGIKAIAVDKVRELK